MLFEYDVIIITALWHRGGGAWNDALFLTTAGNSWADFADNFLFNEARLWQTHETKGKFWTPFQRQTEGRFTG